MANIAQKLKALGDLPQVSLKDVGVSGLSVKYPNDAYERVNGFCGGINGFDDEIIQSSPQDLVDSLGLPLTECSDLKLQHEKMKQAATGSGAYPPNCNPKYSGIHSVALYDDETIWPSHLKRPLTDEEFQSIIAAKVWGPSGSPFERPFTMKELKDTWGGKMLNEVVNDFCIEAYRRFGVVLYIVKTGPNGQHNIHVKYPVIAGGTIGRGWFPGSDPCPGDHVNLHIDKTYTSGFQGQLGLKLHELGHTLQLYHQFTGQNSHQEPMSYRYRNHLCVGYSTGEDVFGIPRSPSVSRLTSLYGGEPVWVPWQGKFDPGTPPTPPGDTFRLETDLVLAKDSNGNTIITNIIEVNGREFIFRPKPQVV